VAAARAVEREQPFVFGPTRLTPATGNRFRQDRDLHFALRVYNWSGNEGAAPELTVAFLFYQQAGKQPRFFNILKPHALNAQTLGTAFDPATRTVTTGMTVPLASFPPGEFVLGVRIRDVRTRASVTQAVRFFVAA
jgi:hypothetical protein